MKRLVLLSLLLLTLINFDIFSQTKEKTKANFLNAESLILFEDYKEALPEYLQLLKMYPDNSNYKFRIGQCYLNISGEKAKSISYFEDAAKNINPEYRKGKYTETGAPYDVLFFLANAYRINNQFEKAIETYKLFKKRITPASKDYDTTLVNLHIQSCLNAKKLMSNPNYVREKNLGNNINQAQPEYNPVISANEDLLVFSRSLPFYDAILYSSRINGIWSSPLNMNELLKVDRDLYPASLSKDGKVLYLYNSAKFDGNIYTSTFENNRWTPIQKLNSNINTKYWESHAVISHDNKKLYFTSNRKGTLGGLDIYVSKREINGDWGPAVNLGPVINTPYNEESPFLSDDDKTLFFSSRGHFNMGGYDIFYSKQLDNGEWSAPENIGYPLNTSDDDLFFKPIKEGYEGYIAQDIPGGYGNMDIYRVEIFSAMHPRKFYVSGIVKVADQIYKLYDSARISVAENKKGDQNLNLIVRSNPYTGEYKFEIPQGNYKITYEVDGGQKTISNFDIPLTYPSDTFKLPLMLLQKAELTAISNAESTKTTTAEKGKTVVSRPVARPKTTPGREKAVSKNQVKSNDQFAALIESLKRRSEDSLKKVVEATDFLKRQFGKADDVISLVKEEAGKKGIVAEDVDKLALKVGVMDNILTQAAVDLLAKYSEGELKNILSGLDIYKEGLKTWDDLLNYISARTGGKIKGDELNNLAMFILAEVDPGIAILRNKILTYSENFEKGDIVRQSVTSVDNNIIKAREKWLLAFFNEAVKQGLTIKQISEMFVTISSFPDTGVGQYLSDLTGQSEGPLIASLKSIDLKKEKIKSPVDLIMFLVTNKDKLKYPDEPVFKSIANLIIAKNIPSDVIASGLTTGEDHQLWILWAMIGAGILFYFIVTRRKKKKKSE